MRQCLHVGWMSFALLCPGEAAEPVFEKDIQSMLQRKCGQCHTGGKRKGGLSLATMADLRRGGESEEAIVGKGLDDSLLWKMISKGEMPPKGKARLTVAETGLIQRWIETGAKSTAPVEVAEKKINQHDVLPIVLLRCTACHGATEQKGGLDLRTPPAMHKGGQNGPALMPGKPDASRMIQRIESQACPPSGLLLKYFVQRPTSTEVKKLRRWISAGAPEMDVKPDVATTEPDHLVTDDDRQHWAFQPPKAKRGATSIDEFIHAKLKAAGLNFAPEANRATLIRRAYLDLTGLPPSLVQWRRWHESRAADWYPKMIDHLLASPRYGERWGRHWLDVAGYADSEGGVSSDPVRKVAWKYRDYVINAFNADKPYDQFLREQIAGDELVDAARAGEVTEKMVNQHTATGFLRMGIDQTGSRTMNFVPERLGVIADALQVLGSGVMGLTLECARCHSHKTDPIPHRDYYRLKAVFQGALDEHDWLNFKTRAFDLATPEHHRRIASTNPPLLKKIKALETQVKKATADAKLELLRAHYPKQSDADRTATLAALRRADNQRSLVQRLLVEKLQRAEAVPDENQPASIQIARNDLTRLERDLTAVRQQLEPPATVRALWDRGRPSPTYILHRGEHDKPGRLVGPGVPSVLTDGRTPFVVRPPFPGKTGRRLALARWLTRADHPLTARVMVNRVWHHHFDAGLVRSLENFGVQGDRPSHPALLDWLAVQFVHDGWSLKTLHRRIMNSRTYRQSSRISSGQAANDPQNRLLSSMPLRRLDAETLRDSILFISGKLDLTAGGPPDAVSVNRDGLVSVMPRAGNGWRRSVYLQHRRTEIPSLLATFDYPVMGPNCLERNVSIVSTQPLMLMNNQHIRELAAAFAARVKQQTTDDGPRVEQAYRLALSRPPSNAEKKLGIAALRQLRRDWNGDADAALTTYCHTLLNSAAFLYID